MKIVFMGTPDFAVPALQALINSKHEVIGVFTQPDKPKGRKNQLVMPPVKELALKYDIPVFQPERMKTEESIEQVRSLNPDCVVVAAFGQILPKAILDIPEYGCINIHASLLPKYRGAAPIQWCIINGEKETGITIQKMGTGIDTGDIMLQEKMEILDTDTGDSLFEKLSKVGGPMVLTVLKQLEEGTAHYEKQDDSQSSYVSILKKEMGELDFTKPAKELECLVRGLNSWPCAYTYLNGIPFKIWASFYKEKRDLQALCGEVTASGKEGIEVQTSEGTLVLTEVQLSGKKRMLADAFLRGYDVPVGTILGKKEQEQE